MIAPVAGLLLLVALLAPAQAPVWCLLVRDDGCVDVALLARRERLPRPPASPEDYARLLAERGEAATVGSPPGFPPELAGKVVQVKVSDRKAPIFVRAEVCRNLERGR